MLGTCAWYRSQLMQVQYNTIQLYCPVANGEMLGTCTWYRSQLKEVQFSTIQYKTIQYNFIARWHTYKERVSVSSTLTHPHPPFPPPHASAVVSSNGVIMYDVFVKRYWWREWRPSSLETSPRFLTLKRLENVHGKWLIEHMAPRKRASLMDARKWQGWN